MTAALLVHRPGLLTTVQDLGRPGLGRFGVSPSGALDPFALCVANRLVGNPDGAAALEITAVGPELEFLADLPFAIAGGHLRASLDGVPCEPWSGGHARAGARLTFGPRRQGARCVLALAGGVSVPAVLGSTATDLDARIGGLGGRPVRAGDRLAVGGLGDGRLRQARLSVRKPYADPFTLRYVPVPHGELPGVMPQAFAAATYRVSPRSNRTGYRLEGPPICFERPADALSEPVPPGAIQVPPDGQPILVLAERPTVGGYPILGCLIAADVPKAAQLWVGHPVHFRPVTIAEARQAWRELEAILATAVVP